MARSRTYVRDSRGRFASTGGGGGGGKGVKRGRTELIRARRSVRQARGKLAAFDPADQSNKSALSKRAQRGAVTRAEKRLAAVRKTAVIKGARVSGTISKNRRQRPAAAPAVTPAPAPAKGTAPKRIRAARPAGTISKSRQPVMRTTPMGNNRVPASQRPGSVTSTLRETLRTLAQLDAKRIREIEAITGQKLTVPQGSMSRKARPQSGSVAGALRETLRTLAQSDARMARETDAILREATRKLPGGKGGGGSKRVKGGASSKALSGAVAPAPAKPKRSRGGGQAAKPAAAPAGRTRRSTVVPALQGSDKLAPLSSQRRKVLERASARQTVLVSMTNDARDKLEKARNKAIPANNPHSNMTPKARKAALTRLQAAEKAYEKLRKSSLTVEAARMFATGFAGATKQGYTRYDNAVRRSDIRAPRAKPKPTRPASKVRAPRPAGTIAKPKGLKPGALAERRGKKVKPIRLPKSAAQAVAQANRLLDKLKMQRMKNPGSGGSYRIRDRIDQVNQAIKKIVPGYRHNPTRKGGAAKAAFAEQNRRYGRDARARNNIGRLYG